MNQIIAVVIDSESEGSLNISLFAMDEQQDVADFSCPHVCSAADGGSLAHDLVNAALTVAATVPVLPESVRPAVPSEGRSHPASSVSETKDETLVTLEITALLQSQVRLEVFGCNCCCVQFIPSNLLSVGPGMT